MRIFVHDFVADKAKIRRRAAARQGFLTQYAAKFAEKTCAYAYEDRFLYGYIFGVGIEPHKIAVDLSSVYAVADNDKYGLSLRDRRYLDLSVNGIYFQPAAVIVLR